MTVIWKFMANLWNRVFLKTNRVFIKTNNIPEESLDFMEVLISTECWKFFLFKFSAAISNVGETRLVVKSQILSVLSCYCNLLVKKSHGDELSRILQALEVHTTFSGCDFCTFVWKIHATQKSRGKNCENLYEIRKIVKSLVKGYAEMNPCDFLFSNFAQI